MTTVNLECNPIYSGASFQLEEKTDSNYMQDLMVMLQKMIELLTVLGKNRSEQAGFTASISDDMLKSLQASASSMSAKAEEANQKAAEAQEQQRWIQGIGIVIGILSTFLTFYCTGPTAGFLTGALFVTMQSGLLEKMFSGVKDLNLRLALKVIFVVGVAAVGAGAAAALDTVILNGAESIASQGANGLASGIGMNGVGAVGSKIGNAASLAKPTAGEIAKGTFANLAFTASMDVNWTTDLADIIAKSMSNNGDSNQNNLKTALTLVLGIVTALLEAVAMIKGVGMTSFGPAMEGMLPQAAKLSLFYKGLQCLMDRSTIMKGIGVATVAESGAEIAQGCTTQDIAKIRAAQGLITALYQMMMLYVDSNGQQNQRTLSESKSAIEELQQAIESSLHMFDPIAAGAQVLL